MMATVDSLNHPWSNGSFLGMTPSIGLSVPNIIYGSDRYGKG